MSRALVSQVLKPEFRIENFVATTSLAEVNAAIAEIEGVRPLKQTEPKFDGPWSRQIIDALRPIGAKIAVGMKPEDVQVWRVAMVAALSDLPPRVAVSALRETLHRPMRFLNEVEGVVREFAAIGLEKQKQALWKLRRMRTEIERAANPPKMIEHTPKVWTQAEIDEANTSFMRLGLRTRWKLVGTECENDEEAMSELQARREQVRADSMRDIDASDIEA